MEGLINFLDKPHFLQVYDREGNLIADQEAPDFHFMPVAVKDGELWVHLRTSYNSSDYSFTLYRYRLDIQEKVNFTCLSPRICVIKRKIMLA